MIAVSGVVVETYNTAGYCIISCRGGSSRYRLSIAVPHGKVEALVIADE